MINDQPREGDGVDINRKLLDSGFCMQGL